MSEPKRSPLTTPKMIVSSLFFGTGLATLLVPILAVLAAFSAHAMTYYAIRSTTPAQLEAQGTVGQWIAGDSVSASALQRSIIIDRDIDQVHVVESKDPKSGIVEIRDDDFWINYKRGPTSLPIATLFMIASLILTTIISVMRFVVRLVRPFLKRRPPPRGFEVMPQEVAAGIHEVDQKGRRVE